MGDGLSRREMLTALVGVAFLPMPKWFLSEDPHSSRRPGRETLYYASLVTVAGRIESGELSPVELTRHMLDRIDAVDERLHGYVLVTADSAIAAARRAEREIRSGRYRGALHGVPIGIKDLCHMRGFPTAAGTTVLADSIPEHDATVVARFKAAGAVILGKLTLCEGAQAPYHPDLEVPVNPWNERHWSGVSSSGSGVATAAGLCFGAVGTDTGGSIRYPSACNGCVGLKPTYGRVSRHGVVPLAESMDHVGPMARTVEDVAVLFEAMAGFDPGDPTSLDRPVPDVRRELGRGIEGLRIGFDRRYATSGVDPEVVAAIEDVLEELRRQGAEIVDVAMPDTSESGAIWYPIGTVEAASAHAATFPSRADEYGPGFRSDLEYGSSVTGVEYARAAKARAEMAAGVRRVLAGVDCLVCPSMSNPAQTKTADPTKITAEEWDRLVHKDEFSKPFNFSGVPTLSVPCGFSSDGLPLSVQFVGSRLDESTIMRVGHAYQQATGWHRRHPRI